MNRGSILNVCYVQAALTAQHTITVDTCASQKNGHKTKKEALGSNYMHEYNTSKSQFNLLTSLLVYIYDD